MTDKLIVESSGAVGRVILNRPEKRNAVNGAMVARFIEAIHAFERSGVRIAELSARGPVFCAGGDLAELETLRLDGLTAALHRSSTVWIASCDGAVVGGGVAIAAACAVVLATERVTFSLPELDRGFFPHGVFEDMQGTLPPRALGRLAVLGDPLAARTAESWGLVSEVANDLDAASRRWVERLQIADAADSITDFWKATASVAREGLS